MKFDTVKLDELLDVLTDYHANGAYKKLKENVELLNKPDYAVMIRTTNFEQNKFESNLKYISEHAYNFLAKSKVQAGDIIMNKIANAGSSYLMPKLEKPVSLAMNLFLLRINPERANPTYVYIYLKINEAYVKNFSNGSVTKTITKEAVRNLEIQLPDRNIQDSIVNIYFSLSDKIELNRQTNQTLEHIAQAIFKSWFVDFEPTRAKIAAKQTGQDPERAAMAAISGKTLDELDQLSPEQQGKLKTTAALFPDALVDSELGEIPEGWEVKLNGNVMDVRDGTHDSPKQSETGFPLVTSKHITTGVLKIKDAYLISEGDYEKVNLRSKVNQGDILLTMIGTVGIPYLVMQPEVNFAIKNVGLFRTSEVKELKNYFYLLLKSPEMQVYLDARLAGTTQKYLSLKVLRAIEMLEPTAELIGAFNDLINPILDRTFAVLMEIESLSELRDSLLPKLLSGELKIESSQTDFDKTA